MKKQTATDTTPRVYIASLSDYNAGSLLGEWFDLEDYSSASELLDAIGEMLRTYDIEHGTTENCGVAREEWAAHDWEGVPSGLTSEYPNLDNLFEYLNAVVELSEDEKEAFQDYCDNIGGEFSADSIEGFRDAYNGQHEKEEDFADQLAEDLGYFAALEKCGMSAHYFDTAAFARDLFCGDYWMSDNGHVFRNN